MTEPRGAMDPSGPPGSELPQVLARGIDSLYVNLYLDLHSTLLRDLESLREAHNAPGGATLLPYRLGDLRHDFGVAGKGWRYRLARDGWTLLLQKRGPRDLAPTVQVQFRSELLWTLGPKRALSRIAKALVPCLGSPRRHRPLESGGRSVEAPWATLNRVDLAVDFAGWKPSASDLPAFVRRARHAASAFTGFGCDSDGDESSAQVRHGGLRFTGFTFGRGALVARLYDKVEEIRTSSRKYWFEQVWGRPLEAGSVWRLEFQLKRQALRDFGVDTPTDLRGNATGLWRALAGWPAHRTERAQERLPAPQELGERESGWLSLRVPTEDTKRSRWPVHPAWQVLQAVDWFDESASPLVRRRLRRLDLEAALGRLLSGLSSAAVAHGLPPEACRTPEDACWELAGAGLLGAHLGRADLSWEELLAEKWSRLELLDLDGSQDGPPA